MAEEEKVINDELTKDLGSGPHFLRTFLLAFVLIGAAAVFAFFYFFTIKVEPWQVGIRYWYWPWPINAMLPQQGERFDILKPGYCVDLPKINTFDIYDRSVQRLDMPDPAAAKATLDAEQSAGTKIEEYMLRPRTLDGNEFDVFVTVIYRIDQSKARNIKMTYQTQIGIREQGVKAKFKGRLVTALSEFDNAQAFYANAGKARERVDKAIREMNAWYEKNDQGIHLDDVLIWDYKFNPAIEARIISKVLEEAGVKLAEAQKEATLEYSKVEKLKGEVQAAYDAEIGRGLAEVLRLDAEGQAELAKAIARGDKLILSAKSEGMGEINRALAQKGGSVYIGLQYAEALKGLELIILPAGGVNGMNPLELEQTLKQLLPKNAPAAVEVVP